MQSQITQFLPYMWILGSIASLDRNPGKKTWLWACVILFTLSFTLRDYFMFKKVIILLLLLLLL